MIFAWVGIHLEIPQHLSPSLVKRPLRASRKRVTLSSKPVSLPPGTSSASDWSVQPLLSSDWSVDGGGWVDAGYIRSDKRREVRPSLSLTYRTGAVEASL